MMSSHVWDVVIVGAGGAHGSAAAYALAKRGIQVLGLEAQPSAPHGFGSSHGFSRIIRSAYHEHPSYVPLLRESFRLWRALERDSGDTLLTMTGCINASVPGAGHAPGAGLSCFEGALRSAQEHFLPHEVLSSQQVAARYQAYRLPPKSKSLYEQEGGVLAPERCIAAHLRLAQAHGAQLVFGAKVLSWQVLLSSSGSSTGSDSTGSGSNQGLVQVCSSRGTFVARRLVLAAGAWMPALVPELASVLEVERQVVGWFSVAPEQRHNFAAEHMPVFLLQDAAGYYYGFPADEHGFKIGKYHHRRQRTTADSVDRSVSPADEEALRRCVRQYFPAADGRLTRASACVFTNTPDEHFILDMHPCHPQVVLASCCSGHGFKFAPVLGEVLADLALQGTTRHDISLHCLAAHRPGFTRMLEAFGGSGSSPAAAVSARL